MHITLLNLPTNYVSLVVWRNVMEQHICSSLKDKSVKHMANVNHRLSIMVFLNVHNNDFKIAILRATKISQTNPLSPPLSWRPYQQSFPRLAYQF